MSHRHPGDCHGPGCRLCFWEHHPTDGRYRRLWGLSEQPAPPVPRTAVHCPRCPGNVRIKVHPGMPVESLLKLIEGDRDGWPADWPHWPVTREAYRKRFREVCQSAASPPQGLEGRGIVICAGGWKFLAGVYTTARILRWLGCRLPIQAWYLGDHGEYDPCFATVTKGLNVEWVDAQALARERGIGVRRWGGWELKPLAAQHSPFAELLSLDADCYPTRDPTFLFDDPRYKDAGAVFWPDFDRNKNGAPLEPGQWERFGLPDRREPDFESGQLVIDKRRGWRALHATNWLCGHSDYSFVHFYGDKSLWHLGWRGTGTDYVMAPPVRWHKVAFLHHDLDGAVLFIHRCRDKPRLPGQDDYRTDQKKKGGRMVRDSVLAHEWLVHQCVGEVERMLKPVVLPGWRPGTADEAVWREVTLENCYRLPEWFGARDVVLDVGSHVGCFAHACLERGAAKVYCLEPEPENFKLLVKNLAGQAGRAVLRRVAAGWPGCPPTLRLTAPPGAEHNAGWTAVTGEGASEAPAVPFDDLLREVTQDGMRRLRLVKLDCEGSEWPILFSSELLHLADEIVGEYHSAAVDGMADWCILTGAEYTPAGLARLLEELGFGVGLYPNPRAEGLGIFRARRR